MAEGDVIVYTLAKKLLAEGGIDFPNDMLKIMLLTSSYTPNRDTDQYISGISANEESGTGYTAGGKTVTSVATSADTVNHRGVIDAPDLVWTGLDIGTPGWAVLYKDTGTPATSPVIEYWELGTTPSTGGDYTLVFGANGLLYIG